MDADEALIEDLKFWAVGNVPFEHLDEDEQDRISERLD